MASIQRQIHTAIITGPTGAIGMALCAKLLAEGVTVYAVTHPGLCFYRHVLDTGNGCRST